VNTSIQVCYVAYLFMGNVVCPRCAVAIVRPLPPDESVTASDEQCLNELRQLYRRRHGLDIDELDHDWLLPMPLPRWGDGSAPLGTPCRGCGITL